MWRTCDRVGFHVGLPGGACQGLREGLCYLVFCVSGRMAATGLSMQILAPVQAVPSPKVDDCSANVPDWAGLRQG
jgi:hypothetical protein